MFAWCCSSVGILWAAAALHMTQDGDTCVEAGIDFLDLFSQKSGPGFETFGDHDDAVLFAAPVSLFNGRGDFFHRRFHFRNQGHFSAAYNAGHHGQVTAGAAHCFHKKGPVV